MGHHDAVLMGEGKNRNEAYRMAVDEFLAENGNRCDIRETLSAKLVEKLPPMKDIVTHERYRDGRGRMITNEVHRSGRDPEAPKSEWVERWRFEVDVHS